MWFWEFRKQQPSGQTRQANPGAQLAVCFHKKSSTTWEPGAWGQNGDFTGQPWALTAGWLVNPSEVIPPAGWQWATLENNVHYPYSLVLQCGIFKITPTGKLTANVGCGTTTTSVNHFFPHFIWIPPGHIISIPLRWAIFRRSFVIAEREGEKR